MFNTPFKNGIIKNTIVAFGALFSNVKIIRHKSDGTVSQTVAVPITYGPKEKVLVRLRQDTDFENQVMVTLPRMAFEIIGYTYDASRAPNRNQKILCYKEDGSVSGTFSPVPYNLDINLYILTKGTEDSLDIIEQILPAFMPEYTATISAIPSMNIVQDVPFSLNGVSVSDDYEGDFATPRLVTHTLSFSAKLNLYGAHGDSKIITRTDVPVENIDGSSTLATHVSTGDATTGTVTSDFWQ